jgi:hypothetical protein
MREQRMSRFVRSGHLFLTVRMTNQKKGNDSYEYVYQNLS